MSEYHLIGQGRREVPLRLTQGWRVLRSAELKTQEPVEVSVAQLAAQALAAPIGKPPLAALARGVQRVAIVVDDLTRPTPRRALLEEVVGLLVQEGITRGQIDVIIGGGTHRLLTEEEIERTFGPELSRDLHIVNHDCHATDLVSVGTLPNSGEVLINRLFMEADLRIAIGSILPHPWNGFGGGAKAILPGIAGWVTIKRHHLALVTAPGVTFGNLSGNPFHDEVYQAGKMARLDFIVDAVYNANEDVKGVVAGDFEEAYRYGAQLCVEEMGVGFEEAADVTIASVFPYCDAPQTMKPLGPATLVTKEGGTVILYVDELEQGCYPESMLAAFSKALSLAKGDPRGLVFDYLSRGELIAPEAPMDNNSAINTTLLFLSRVKVLLVSRDSDAQQAARLGFDYAPTLEEATERVAREVPRATVNILPAGGLVLPLLAESMKFEY